MSGRFISLVVRVFYTRPPPLACGDSSASVNCLQLPEPHQEIETNDTTTASGLVSFLSKDPIGISGGLNQYVFCHNDPVNFIDPMGLDAYVIVTERNGWKLISGFGHAAIAVDDGEMVLRADDALGVEPILRTYGGRDKYKNAFMNAGTILVLPNIQLGNGSTSDAEIAKYIRSGKQPYWSSYCSEYVAAVALNGDYYLGGGVTPKSLISFSKINIMNNENIVEKDVADFLHDNTNSKGCE